MGELDKKWLVVLVLAVIVIVVVLVLINRGSSSTASFSKIQYKDSIKTFTINAAGAIDMSYNNGYIVYITLTTAVIYNITSQTFITVNQTFSANSSIIAQDSGIYILDGRILYLTDYTGQNISIIDNFVADIVSCPSRAALRVDYVNGDNMFIGTEGIAQSINYQEPSSTVKAFGSVMLTLL